MQILTNLPISRCLIFKVLLASLIEERALHFITLSCVCQALFSSLFWDSLDIVSLVRCFVKIFFRLSRRLDYNTTPPPTPFSSSFAGRHCRAQDACRPGHYGLFRPGSFSSADIDLLAKVISAESRGEPYAGQVAVGAVILNRMEHPPSRIRSPASSISRARSPASMTAESTLRSPRALTAPPVTPSTARILRRSHLLL